jgi:osmotically-inducible protein OsmY
MRIVAFMAVAALVGCARNDRTATEGPVSTTTVTLAPITIAGPSDEELDRRANAASVAHVTGAMETFDDLTGHPFSLPEGDDRTQFHIQMALLEDADFVAHASDIDVQVDQGIVTLRGVTTTPRARAAAERIASRQSGVFEVDNRLRIGPALPPTGHRSE